MREGFGGGAKLYYYLIWLAALSLITFIFYGFDKDRAKRKGARVPENALHLLALAGGFMGGWVGRGLFHHKTQKPMFTLILVVSTMGHAGIFWCVFLR
jgi:uncharacterized membrane protein YsdA (DUF1294 family)